MFGLHVDGAVRGLAGRTGNCAGLRGEEGSGETGAVGRQPRAEQVCRAAVGGRLSGSSEELPESPDLVQDMGVLKAWE